MPFARLAWQCAEQALDGRIFSNLTFARRARPAVQIYMASPTFAEADGKVGTLFPADARLRNLTYAANLYIDATVVYVYMTNL
jgi:DNA-directed RNA polymerase beta subunit